jgi:hypothetical protein
VDYETVAYQQLDKCRRSFFIPCKIRDKKIFRDPKNNLPDYIFIAGYENNR